MRLTTRGRYAVTAAVDLALHQQEGPVPLSAIAVRQELSQTYLEQLLLKMRRQQLVQSVRGPGGGYALARPAEDISVAEVMWAVEEPLDSTQCGGKRNCRRDRPCLTHDLWASLNVEVERFLKGVSLAEVAQGGHHGLAD